MKDSRNFALIVANSVFPLAPDLAPLRGPRKDPAVLHHALTHEQTGLFHSDDVCVATERESKQVMEELEDIVDQAGPADRVLVYYSGHGLPDKFNRLYLCTNDTRTDRLASSAVSTEMISTVLGNGRMRSTVVLLDCCYSGNFKAATTVPEQLTGAGRFVITASRTGELAQDALAKNQASVFTAALSRGLLSEAADLNGDGYVTLEEIYQYVHATLSEAGGAIPKRDFSGDGDFAIARRTSHGDINSLASGSAGGSAGVPPAPPIVSPIQIAPPAPPPPPPGWRVELIERTRMDIVLRAIRGAESFTVALRDSVLGTAKVYVNGRKVGTLSSTARDQWNRLGWTCSHDLDPAQGGHHLVLDTTQTLTGRLVHARLRCDGAVIFEQEFAADR